MGRYIVTCRLTLLLFLQLTISFPTVAFNSPISSNMLSTTLVLLFFYAALVAPCHFLGTRVTSQCGQYQSKSSGPYTLYTNGWSWSSGTGSQCSQIDKLSGSSLAWSTTWSWSGTSNQVKSYTNVETVFTKKALSAYTSMPTTWKWNYTGTDLRVNGKHTPYLVRPQR
jgi:xyloglucan-specific endo-beta-1,4-glucanase